VVAEYLSGNLYPVRAAIVETTAGATGRDYLMPFFVRKSVAISQVGWFRKVVTAANVYVGIYNSAGTLLTDCAVDADTSANVWHVVPTSAVNLTAGSIYYALLNQSVDVAGAWPLAQANTTQELVSGPGVYGYALGLGVSGVISGLTTYRKSRVAAAPLASLVMSGWANETGVTPAMGFVPA